MRFSFYIMFILAFSMFSCKEYVEGPQGPAGRDGLNGIDGKDGEEAFVLEYEVDFVGPDYSVLINFPDDFYPLSSDVVQVYLLWEVEEEVDIWRPLPQTIFTNDGLFQYNYDFTFDNVKLFLDAEFPISSMGAGYLLDQIMRIVVIPGQFLEDARMDLDLSDYDEVARRFNLNQVVKVK